MSLTFRNTSMILAGLAIIAFALIDGTKLVGAIWARLFFRKDKRTALSMKIRPNLANLGALAKAKAMTAKGISRSEIWRDTGWYKHPDTGWRNEIDDSAASLSREEVRSLVQRMSGTPRLVGLLLYGAGLRLMEALRLRVKDVDFTTNQIDSNYQGNLLLATEDAAHQGFATSEPYKYSVLDSGAITTGYQLIHDAGWTNYPQSLAIRADRLAEFSPCLSKLVPMMQQAQIDYIGAPQRANEIIIATTKVYDSWWTQTEGDTANGAKTQKDLGIIGNGETATFGDFEDARMRDFIAKALPIFRAQGLEVMDVVPSDLATNQFLDPTITYSG